MGARLAGDRAGEVYKSGENEILAHGLDHFPGAFHPGLDHEHVTGLQVLRLFAFRGDDAVAIKEG